MKVLVKIIVGDSISFNYSECVSACQCWFKCQCHPVSMSVIAIAIVSISDSVDVSKLS